MKKKLNVAMIGTGFMGKAHSNGLRQVPVFFNDLGVAPVLKVACSIEEPSVLRAFADQYGWEKTSNDYQAVINDPEIDVVDICAPGALHKDIALAAAKAGKHIFCEKPISSAYEEAAEMAQAVEKAGVVHMVNFNYRRVPAVELAKKLVSEGRIGKVFSFNGFYQQDWAIDPEMPMVWRMAIENVGIGPAEAGSHIYDLARWMIGDIREVAGASSVCIDRRSARAGGEKNIPVTSDDDFVFIGRFECGALGVFHTSRVNAGRKNQLMFEINGSKGSIRFELERLDELQVYFIEEKEPELAGFRRVLATEPQHKYVKNWWPSGHIIGWEHLFVHQYYEFFKGIETGVLPQPNFFDGLENQRVIEAIGIADAERRWVNVKNFKK